MNLKYQVHVIYIQEIYALHISNKQECIFIGRNVTYILLFCYIYEVLLIQNINYIYRNCGIKCNLLVNVLFSIYIQISLCKVCQQLSFTYNICEPPSGPLNQESAMIGKIRHSNWLTILQRERRRSCSANQGKVFPLSPNLN